MSKRIEFKQWKKQLTPSGYWDNGFWVLTNDSISFPKNILENSIIAETELKTDDSRYATKKAYKVTHGNQTWVVNENPL